MDFLNHEHNNGKSILMTINNLPDKYRQESPGNGRSGKVISEWPLNRGTYPGQLKARW